ncbi:hypothetical protein ACO0QE_002157 [Hanseniaspora vineae]
MFKLYTHPHSENVSSQSYRTSGNESETSSFAQVDLSTTVSDLNSSGASYLRYSMNSLFNSAGVLNTPRLQNGLSTSTRWDSFEQLSEPEGTENEEFTVLSLSTGSDIESGSRSYSLVSHPVSESRSDSLNNGLSTPRLATKQTKPLTPAYVISLSDSEMASAKVGSQSAMSLLGSEKYSNKNISNDKLYENYRFRVMKTLDYLDQQKPRLYRYTRGDFQLVFEYLAEKRFELHKKQQQSLQHNNTKVKDIPSVFGEHKDLLFQISLGMST